MASWEPVDIDPIDRDEIGEEDYEWDDDLMADLEKRFDELRQFNRTLNESRDENIREESMVFIDALKHETTELIADQIYDRLIILFNDIKKIRYKKRYTCRRTYQKLR